MTQRRRLTNRDLLFSRWQFWQLLLGGILAVLGNAGTVLTTAEQGIQEHTLVNGLKVVLVEDHWHLLAALAVCHGNDGSGQTEIGENLYPKAPDMRQSDTQSLSDGELFYIIHNGIRLTGMSAWGEGPSEEDLDSWKLVHFIRHLPEIKPEEIEEMKKLNLKSPQEGKEEEEIEKFLQGEDSPATVPQHH